MAFSFKNILAQLVQQGTLPTPPTGTTTPTSLPPIPISQYTGGGKGKGGWGPQVSWQGGAKVQGQGKGQSKDKKQKKVSDLPDTRMRMALDQFIMSQGGAQPFLEAKGVDLPDPFSARAQTTGNRGDYASQIVQLARSTAKPQVKSMLAYMQENGQVPRREGMEALLDTLGQSASLNKALGVDTQTAPTPATDILSESYARGQEAAQRNVALKQQQQYEAHMQETLNTVVIPRVQTYTAIQNDMINQWQAGQYDRAARIQDPDRQAMVVSAIDNLALLKRMQNEQWANSFITPYTQGQKGTFGDVLSKWVGSETAMQNRFDAPISAITAGNRQLTAPQTQGTGSSLAQLFGPTSNTELARANTYSPQQSPYSPEQFTFDSGGDELSQIIAQMAVQGIDTSEIYDQ